METLTKIGGALLSSTLGLIIGLMLCGVCIKVNAALWKYAEKKTKDTFKQYLIVAAPQIIVCWLGISVFAALS